MTYQSVNPFNGDVLKSYDTLSNERLEAAIQAASSCFDVWRRTPFEARARIIARAAGVLRSRKDELARAMTLDMGKRINEARGEVAFSADILDYYAEHAAAFLAPVDLSPKVGKAHMETSPLGIIFCVEPWNFPYYQLARVAGPHLMAGNVLLVKHASNVPHCALLFEDILTEAGAPKGLYTNLFVSHQQSNDLIDDPRIKGVALTGSVEAGRKVAARAGENVKVSSMELGGSDAFIVLDDADIDHAVKWAVWGRMYNTGQTCCAAKRFIVLDKVADVFLQKFQTALKALTPGNPMDEATTLGPLSSEAALLQLLAQVDVADKHGAHVLMGGKRLNLGGAFMQPTILTNVTPDNPAFRGEFFGPVAMFFRVTDEDAAVALANDSDFGLGGSVFTRDAARGHRIASRVDTGMMFINNISWSDAELPFGGIKNSGYGRELGNMGIQEFVNKKLVRSGDFAAPM